MKLKKKCIIILILMLSVVNVMLNIKYKNLNVSQNSQLVENEIITSEDVTVLMTNLSISALPGFPMDGWFPEHLKEELGIELWQADYPVTPGVFYGCEESMVDLCWFQASEGYYDAVREGKLKNLEDEIKKRPQIYQRYQNALDQMKSDTFEHTEKKGLFGIPIWLNSSNDINKEGNCLAIPVVSSHPELAMELITYSATDEGIMNIAFGPEGQMWEKENGRYVLLEDWWEVSSEDLNRNFIETKDGMEDYATARCQLELIGNERLGRELLAISSVNRRENL